jgi:hypothetical protein
MFGNGTNEYIPNMFQHKIRKSSLCDFCKEKDAIIDYYVQTCSYYRNSSNQHCFMCSQKCHDNYKKYKKCHKCGYDADLIFIGDKNYSLCTSYPYNISCYDREIKFNQFVDDNTAICSFCNIRTDPPSKYYRSNSKYIEREISNDILLNICNKCNDIYSNIVLWNHDKLYTDCYQTDCCVFCRKNVNTDTISKICRYDYDYNIYMCKSCHTNYTYLVN